jgi:hypothetical protein
MLCSEARCVHEPLMDGSVRETCGRPRGARRNENTRPLRLKECVVVSATS